MNYKAVYRTAPATPGLLINDKVVYRTAPATPGLLNTGIFNIFYSYFHLGEAKLYWKTKSQQIQALILTK